MERHGTPPPICLNVGLLNILSVNRKTENVPDLFNKDGLGAQVLAEVWNDDVDSVSIKRLCSLGLNVIEATRAIPPSAVLDNIHL